MGLSEENFDCLDLFFMGMSLPTIRPSKYLLPPDVGLYLEAQLLSGPPIQSASTPRCL